MTTQLAVPETTPRTPAVLTPWAAWSEKMSFAKELVGTGFCPSAIKTPAQALAVILTGQELGIPPMHSLRSIHVIQGKPTLSAELMLALMLKGGVKLTWGQSDAKAATLTAERGTTAFTGTFTMAEADAAKLTTKDGWRNYPAAMLRARVIALTARVVAPDLIAGMYTAEELGADVDAEGTIVSAPRVVTAEPADDIRVATPPSTPGSARVAVGDQVHSETEPETGRQEVPVNGQDWAPIEEWKEAMRKAQTLKALQHLWKGVTAPDLWETWSESGQAELTAEKDAAKQRLSA